MTRKTNQLYEAALNHLTYVCFQQTVRRPTPLLLVSNYELAILQAMTNCFPTESARVLVSFRKCKLVAFI